MTNDIERLIDRCKMGEITADEANVEKVRILRVHLVSSPIFRDVRRALNAAVKRGYLAHMPKNGHKPEAYYHPEFEYLANEMRANHEASIIRSARGVLAINTGEMQ